MIQWLEVSNFEERNTCLIQQPKNGIYIVPDIKSKHKFQDILLKKTSLIPASSIERASDFYCKLFSYTFPDYTIISAPHLEFLFQVWVKNIYNKPVQKIQPRISILSYLQSFLPILSHPEGSQLFEQWIKESPTYKRYKQGYELTKSFWKELKNLKMMEKSCIKYFLPSHELNIWDFSLTVDLSFSLDYTELEIYTYLGHRQDVTVLVPPPLQSQIFTQSHTIYSLLKKQAQPLKSTVGNKKHNAQSFLKPPCSQKKVRKFQSMVEEIQFVTEQLREGLEKGLSPHQLAVVAPNIEIYKPCLNSYLKKEGIPFQKENSISYLTFPQIQKWLSSIRLHFGIITFENLEDTLFSIENQYHSLNKIKSKYYYSDRNKDIQDLPIIPILDKELSLNEFLEVILNLWKPIIKKFPNIEIESDLNNILTELAHPLSHLNSLKASKEDWIEILENTLSKKDKIQNSHLKGVHCLSLNAITSLDAKQVHLVGLDHHSCQNFYPSIFNEIDAQKILNDLGFYCTHIDSHQNEYELVHFLNSFRGSLTISYSQNHFSQQITHPSRVWHLEYEQKSHHEETQMKKPQTVWNSIKKLSSMDDILQYTSTSHAKSDIKLNLDHPDEIHNHLTFPIQNISLSPTSIKKYVSCPFVFLSEDIFHLSESRFKDTDLNPLNKGSIFHEFFERIIKDDLHDEASIQKLIESMKDSFEVMDDSVFKFYSKELLNKAFQFLANEKTYHQILPEIKNLGTEMKFKGFWNFEKQKLDSTGDIAISGKIDRMILYKDQILIIDYKSSIKNTKNISYWSKNEIDIQMPLYIQAVEENLLPESNHYTISGALYLSYKNFEFKGFISKNSDWKNILNKKNRMCIEEDKKDEILTQVSKVLQTKIKNIQEGKFFPKPIQLANCKTCHWNKICRAPHLN